MIFHEVIRGDNFGLLKIIKGNNFVNNFGSDGNIQLSTCHKLSMPLQNTINALENRTVQKPIQS